MRILKLGLISFVFFALLLFLMGLLVPSHVRISKAINLAAADSAVLHKVSNVAQWPAWHPAYRQGLLEKATLVKTVDTDSLVVVNIAHGANSVLNSWQLHRFSTADSLTLQWYMDFKLSVWPWHRFSSLFYEATYGRMMEQGLKNLRQAADSAQGGNRRFPE